MGSPGAWHEGFALTAKQPAFERAVEADLPPPRRGRRLPSRPPIWADPWAVSLFMLAVAIDGALGFALWRYIDTFPELIALHFSVYGEVDIIGPKSDIFRLPLIGVVIWAANGAVAVMLPARDRILARTVLAFAVGVLVLFCLAAWRIVT